MKSVAKALLYGLAVWVIPFVVAIMIFPLRESDRPLFESIMPVAVTLAVVFFANRYFLGVEGAFVREGILLGALWLVISMVIDLFMFSWGPVKMSFVDYVKDIGITYLLMPVITVGMGQLLRRKVAR
ncbi:MAG: hypothetical protein AABZ02_08745 [Bacteroidota bacterium]